MYGDEWIVETCFHIAQPRKINFERFLKFIFLKSNEPKTTLHPPPLHHLIFIMISKDIES